MKTDVHGRVVRCLTDKQYEQLISISEKVQPYLPFEEVAFDRLLKLTYSYLISWCNAELTLRNDLAKFNAKYYTKGFKINNRGLSTRQCTIIYKSYYRPRAIAYMKPYKQIERDAFVMMFRACKRYLITGLTKESEDVLINRLEAIVKILR